MGKFATKSVVGVATAVAMSSLLWSAVACHPPGAGQSPVVPTPAVAEVGFSAADRAAIERVLIDQAAAWNRGDLDGYMAGYLRSDSLVFTSGAKVRTGYDETFAAYRKRYGTDRSSMGTLLFKISRIDPVGMGGAVVLGRWDLALASGPTGGIFSVVLERTPQGWLIVHDHTSVDPPVPAK
jgi:ketosteroid isomerase-like protein